MPPKNTKKNSAKSAIPKSKTPGPELQPKEYVSNYFAIHRLLSFELISGKKINSLPWNKIKLLIFYRENEFLNGLYEVELRK